MIQSSEYQALSVHLNGLNSAEQTLIIEETKKAVCAIREVCYVYLVGFMTVTP
jgi:hypothetical protein